MLPYLARALNVDEYGSYGQVLMLSELAILIFSFGLSQILFIQYSDDKNDKKNVFVTNLLVNVILGFIGALSIYVFSGTIGQIFDNNTIIPLLKIYCFQFFFQLITAYLNSTLIQFNKVKQMVIISITINILRIGVLFFAIQYLQSLIYVFIFLLITSMLNCLWSLYYIPKGFFRGAWEKQLAKRQIAIGFPLGLTGLIGTIFKRTDGIMISSMLPTSEYALYRMGAIEVPLLYTLYYSVTTIVMPEVTQLFNKVKIKKLTELKRREISNSMDLIYPTLIFVLIFSQPIIGAYLGEKYEQSANIFLIYNLVLFIRVNDYRDILISGSKTRIILQYVFICFFINLILNFVFIRYFGVIGAVIASLISFYLLAFLLFNRTLKLTRTKTGHFFNLSLMYKIILISLVASCLMYIVYYCFPCLPIILILFIIHSILVYSMLIRYQLLEIEILLSLFSNRPFIQKQIKKVATLLSKSDKI